MRRIQKLIKVLLPLAFGIGIVWFILQKVDMQLLIDTVKSGINWTWVIISWAFALLANVVRGLRWRQQLRTVGVNPSLHEMSISFFGNYGMNLVFPRLGEFWRCNYIAQNTSPTFFRIRVLPSGKRIIMPCGLEFNTVFAFAKFLKIGYSCH